MLNLTQLLRSYGDRTQLLLELKIRHRDKIHNQKMMEKVVHALTDGQLNNSTMLLCYDLELLRFGYKLAPDLRYVWNQDRPIKPTLLRDDFLFAYSLQHRAISQSTVDHIHELEKYVFTFTVDDHRRLKKVIAAGVDGVMSNRPAWLAGELAIQNVRPIKKEKAW